MAMNVATPAVIGRDEGAGDDRRAADALAARLVESGDERGHGDHDGRLPEGSMTRPTSRGDGATLARVSRRHSTPTGRLIAKTHRHPTVVVRTPPCHAGVSTEDPLRPATAPARP
jgi:hypothetical protein